MRRSYNRFTLEDIIREFGLQVVPSDGLFADVSPVVIGDVMRQFLQEYSPLALEIGTEKARSEFMIAPILAEVRRQMENRVSLFSGVAFNVDPERGLRGICDFLFSLSPLQLAIEAPVVVIVEAKRENINKGLVQCMAEMVAAQQFNTQRGATGGLVFGAVTTGNVWRFLQLADSLVTVDTDEYYLNQVDQIAGILISMLRKAGAT